MDNIGDNPFVGIFIGSHNADVLEEARVYNVRVDRPMPASFNFNGADSIGSRLEIMDVLRVSAKLYMKVRSDSKHLTGCPMVKDFI